MEGEMKLCSALRGEDNVIPRQLRDYSTAVLAISHTEYDVESSGIERCFNASEKVHVVTTGSVQNVLCTHLTATCWPFPCLVSGFFLPLIKVTEQGLHQVHQPCVAISVALEPFS